MARPDKAAAVAELTEDFRTASATVLTEYRGLTVAQLKELRRSLGATTKYAVVKNTLTKIAAKQAGVEVPEDLLAGPSAVAFVKGDPVEAAKSLRDFAKAHPFLVIKGGILDGKTLSATEIGKLADLESREVLLAKLAGAMKASMSQAVALFAAPLSKAVRTVDALRPLKADDASAAAPAAADVAPAADPTPAAEDTPAEVTAEATTEAETSEAPATEQSNEG
jgi:large subunit ribosomal protein L10